MENRKPVFDRTKHCLWSSAAQQVLLSRLRQDFPAQADELWEKLQEIYLGYLTALPDLGGRRNPQAGGIYDSLALFAYYEAVPRKPSLEEFEALNRAVFVPQTRGRGVADLNRPWMLRAANGVFRFIARQTRRWPAGYHMEILPFDPRLGIRYRFHSCPIADFARAHGLEHLMPALCNPDYPMLETMHAGLIRTTTCANGSCCDYWIVGDRHPALKTHPLRRDEAGYLRNDSGFGDLPES